jgi:predicted Zn-dependent protease
LPAPGGGEKTPANSKMARLPEREVDPNFDFTDIEWELKSQCDALDRRYEREGMIMNDPDLEAYVGRVGQSVLPSAVPLPNVAWRFHVLRDPVPNAFSMPNGSVYVNTGLLALLDNESQLASVLAHEISHVTGRHSYRANRSYRKKALTVSIFQMAGSYAPGNTNWGATIRVAAVAVPSLVQASILGYDRELERQADLFALEKLRQSDYDPREMANVFQHLDEKPEVDLQTFFYNDHPKLQDRISYVNQYLAEHTVESGSSSQPQISQYREAVARALRTNVQLAIGADRPRTAHVIAKRLVDWDQTSTDNMLTLADTYRALGPWTAQPTADEMSSKGKKDLAKMKSKLTPAEEAEKVRSSPQGQANFRENTRQAEELYKKVLEIDPSKAIAYKSLGQMYESERDIDSARQAYQKYVAATEDASDAERVQRKLATLGPTLRQK